VPRDNESINESWLSDRDRCSHTGLNAADRLRTPMLRDCANWREASWDEALARAAELMKATAQGDLAMLVHPATSNEEGRLLRRLADGLGCERIDHRLTQSDFADAPIAHPFEMPLAEVEAASSILLIGCNPRLEAPILGHRVRKAWKRGARISVLNPVAFDFHFEVAHEAIVAPDAMVDALLSLARVAGENSSETPPAGLAEALAGATVDVADRALLQSLRDASSALLVLGEIAVNHPQASWLRALAHYVARCVGARVDELPQGANAVGLARAGLLPRDPASGPFAAPASCWILYGIEPEFDFGDNALALQRLSQADSVVAFTAFASAALQATAQVLLPIGLLPEIEGSLTNAEGHTQFVAAGAKLPGDARQGWRVLRALGERLAIPGFEFLDLEGLHAQPASVPASAGRGVAPRVTPTEGLARIATTAVYRSDAVVRRAAPLNAHALTTGPALTLHPEDALRIGLSEGAIAKVDDGRGVAALPTRISSAVAKGGAWIERGYAASAPIAGTGARLIVSKA
jgi:NADH-quinone oxidoreductase subunit G